MYDKVDGGNRKMVRVIYKVQDGIAQLRLQRPEKKNALDLAMYDEISDTIELAVVDPDVRCLLIAGSPGVFCAGNDIDVFVDTTIDILPPILRFMNLLHSFPKPVVAAVDGPAIGVGATMLLHCDLIVAAESARFQFPFVSLGICPEFGSSMLLAQRCGHHRAAELLLLAEPVSALAMQSMNLVNDVVPATALMAHAFAKASRLASLPPDAMQAVKAMMRRGAGAPLGGLFNEEMTQLSRMIKSDEARQIFAAFMARKKTG